VDDPVGEFEGVGEFVGVGELVGVLVGVTEVVGDGDDVCDGVGVGEGKGVCDIVGVAGACVGVMDGVGDSLGSDDGAGDSEVDGLGVMEGVGEGVGWSMSDTDAIWTRQSDAPAQYTAKNMNSSVPLGNLYPGSHKSTHRLSSARWRYVTPSKSHAVSLSRFAWSTNHTEKGVPEAAVLYAANRAR
jgi:hypothetical protein